MIGNYNKNKDMTKEESLEVLRKGNELADKLIEVLQKELGDEVPSSITLYAAAKFTASILYAVRKQTNDDTIEKDFFVFVKTLLGNVIDSSLALDMQNLSREAEQKLAEHKKRMAEFDKEMEGFDRRYDEFKRKIAENEIRLSVLKQEHNLIIHSSDEDKLN